MSEQILDMMGVATLFRVSYTTVQTWRRRSYLGFPEPDLIFGRSPVWKESTIRTWGTETGRLR